MGYFLLHWSEFKRLCWSHVTDSAQPEASQTSSDIDEVNAALGFPQENVDRPTSKPYTGDLAIFEDRLRDRNLKLVV